MLRRRAYKSLISRGERRAKKHTRREVIDAELESSQSLGHKIARARLCGRQVQEANARVVSEMKREP